MKLCLFVISVFHSACEVISFSVFRCRNAVNMVNWEVSCVFEPFKICVYHHFFFKILATFVFVFNRLQESFQVFIFGVVLFLVSGVLGILFFSKHLIAPLLQHIIVFIFSLKLFSQLHLVIIQQAKFEIVYFTFIIVVNFFEKKAEVRKG